MSEEKKEKRNKQQISIEYSQGCTKAGHLQYQIATLQKDLAMLNDHLRDLNIEAATLPKEEESTNENPSN